MWDHAIITAWISAIGTWAAILGGAVFLWKQNRKAKELTCLQLYLQLSVQYESREMNIRRARLATELLREPKPLEIDDSVIVFYENVGLLVERGLLDIELIDNVIGFDVSNYWKALEYYVEHVREEFNDKTIFVCFQNLAKSLEEFRRRQYQQNQKYENVRGINTTVFLQMEQRRDFQSSVPIALPGPQETQLKSLIKS